jgi:hypothetical protein
MKLELQDRRRAINPSNFCGTVPTAAFAWATRRSAPHKWKLPSRAMYSVLLDGLSYDTSVEETLTGLVVVVDGLPLRN